MNTNQNSETGKEPSKGKKTDKKTVFRYLRELSVVVAGVAITFIVSGWISLHNERRGLERYLASVKTELEDNLQEVEYIHQFYRQTGILSRYLASDLPENLNRDSVASYNSYENGELTSRVFTVTFKSSAFESLKVSGLMPLIRDKELSRSILESYMILESVKKESDDYMDRKINEIYGNVLENQLLSVDVLDPRMKRLYYFFALYNNIDVRFKRCSIQLDETLSLLDKTIEPQK